MTAGERMDLGGAASGPMVTARYRVERVLGEGASSVVYAAIDEKDGRAVALKVLHRHLVRDPQISRRFNREARILRGLRGAHLVSLLDYGETGDGLLFMALERIDGLSLDRLIGNGRFAAERAAAIARQICEALQLAHGAGVVHRDLKPSNVLVEASNDGEQVWVVDFGMAKVVRGDVGSSLNALTEQNMVFGTPEYMAPEQARGDEVDERADLYAVGVILYELLTGSVPFSRNNPIGTMTAHLLEEPVPPSSRAPERDIPPALEAVVLHALAKQPSARYASAEELGRALERAILCPADVASTAPPPKGEEPDLATCDTEHAIRVSEVFREPPGPGQPLEAPLPERASRAWIAIGIIAILLGMAIGVVMSLSGSV
ncbi:MAG: serine/threonine-protein kinase [Sorangiineae bacterium]|nr:serine/threonine-protein kinase [Polyangiaceae bacterium]MEB2323741.1 serine/threonine-protein kinase [Sorangiineae bacterium]